VHQTMLKSFITNWCTLCASVGNKRFNKFDSVQKSLDFLLELMTLVSSANNDGSDIEFILRGRSFIYLM